MAKLLHSPTCWTAQHHHPTLAVRQQHVCLRLLTSLGTAPEGGVGGLGNAYSGRPMSHQLGHGAPRQDMRGGTLQHNQLSNAGGQIQGWPQVVSLVLVTCMTSARQMKDAGVLHGVLQALQELVLDWIPSLAMSACLGQTGSDLQSFGALMGRSQCDWLGTTKPAYKVHILHISHDALPAS